MEGYKGGNLKGKERIGKGGFLVRESMENGFILLLVFTEILEFLGNFLNNKLGGSNGGRDIIYAI